MAGKIYAVLMGLIIFFSIIIGKKQVVEVCQKILKTVRLFNHGHVFEELFHHRYSFSHETEEMFSKMEGIFKRREMFEQSKEQAQYLALQNQINPHFLYNTLEAIRADALVAGSNTIAQTAEALATFFRYTISEVESLVTLEDELDNVKNFFIIQQYRFGKKLDMRVHVLEEDMTVFQSCIPKLTLQPIVENAICHGLERKLGGGVIQIEIEHTKSNLFIHIRDNGKGMDELCLEEINSKLKQQDRIYDHPTSRQGGIALWNVNTRIKLLFGEKYGINIYSTLNVGTHVKITLPYIAKGKEEQLDWKENIIRKNL
ncbi:sensor histidine kinase [Anaerosacchariphilus polymeriproducens]|nr:histidine kinase [Anaerosacchariphilus polymeriproducens]